MELDGLFVHTTYYNNIICNKYMRHSMLYSCTVCIIGISYLLIYIFDKINIQAVRKWARNRLILHWMWARNLRLLWNEEPFGSNCGGNGDNNGRGMAMLGLWLIERMSNHRNCTAIGNSRNRWESTCVCVGPQFTHTHTHTCIYPYIIQALNYRGECVANWAATGMNEYGCCI